MSWLGPIPKQWWSSLRSREFPALYTGDMLSRAWPGQDVIASCAFAQLHLFLPLVPAMSFRVEFRFDYWISAVTMPLWLHGFFFYFFPFWEVFLHSMFTLRSHWLPFFAISLAVSRSDIWDSTSFKVFLSVDTPLCPSWILFDRLVIFWDTSFCSTWRLR